MTVALSQSRKKVNNMTNWYFYTYFSEKNTCEKIFENEYSVLGAFLIKIVTCLEGSALGGQC